MSVAKITIAVLSILSIGLISISFFIDVDKELYRLIEYFDFLFCLFFFIDFLKQIFSSENKVRYFFTYGWIDLLSSIPTVGAFRYARVLRIFRVIRIIKSVKLLVEFLKQEKQKVAYSFIVIFIILSVLISTSLVLELEHTVGNIKTAEDALWWTFITITTVGYGDYYPVTNEGKLITAFLIMNGILGFGVVVSYLNSTLNSFNHKKQ